MNNSSTGDLYNPLGNPTATVWGTPTATKPSSVSSGVPTTPLKGQATGIAPVKDPATIAQEQYLKDRNASAGLPSGEALSIKANSAFMVPLSANLAVANNNNAAAGKAAGEAADRAGSVASLAGAKLTANKNLAPLNTAYTPTVGTTIDPTKPVVLKSTDPHFEQSATAILQQNAAAKAETTLQMQQQSQKMQYLQQLQDSGQKGSTLATLSMLKDREMNSTAAGLHWDLTNKYIDTLNTMQHDADTDAKAKFTAQYNGYVAAGDMDSANAIASVAAQTFPTDNYWSFANSDAGRAAMLKGATPAIQKLHSDALNTAVDTATSSNNLFSPTGMENARKTAITDIGSSYSTEDKQVMVQTTSDADAEAYAKQYYPGVNFNGVYPDSLKVEAHLSGIVTTRLSTALSEQASTKAAEGLMSVDKLDQTSSNMLQQTMGQLSQKEGATVTIAGVTVPASDFDNTSDGASSIYLTDWNGHPISSSNPRPAENTAYDGLWMRAVQANNGDINMTRDAFRDLAASTLSGMGVDYKAAGNLSKSELNSVWAKMAVTTGAGGATKLIQGASTGNSSSSAFSTAAQTGGAAGLFAAQSKNGVLLTDEKTQSSISGAIEGLQKNGPIPSLDSVANLTTADMKTGDQYVYVKAGSAKYATLAKVTNSEPVWNPTKKEYDYTTTIEDPTGSTTNTVVEHTMETPVGDAWADKNPLSRASIALDNARARRSSGGHYNDTAYQARVQKRLDEHYVG